MRKSIPIAGRSRSPDDPLPPGAAGRLFPGRGPSVGLRPPFTPRPGNFLILIDGNSHLDCRAATGPSSAHRPVSPTTACSCVILLRSGRSGFVVYAKPPFTGPEAVLAYLSRYT